MDPKKVFYSTLEDDDKYNDLNFKELKYSDQEEILLLLMKQIFFYSGNKFKNKKIKEKMRKFEWLNLFFGGITTTFLITKDKGHIYGLVIKYFCDDYDNIKKYFVQFIKEMEKIKSKINFDLFEVAVCFMCFLNGNNKFFDIISCLKKNGNIKLLEIYNDKELTKKTLYQLITEYCILYKYPIILSEECNKEDITKERIIEQMRLFQCYAELCPITEAYKNFILSLYSCLKDCEDLRIKREKKVAEFIEEIFILLTLHLKIPDYWEDSNILLINSDIYNAAFKYSTDNFDQNYIDFVISYITYYQIPVEDFMCIFLKGLNETEFNRNFKNCQLNETIGNINDKETIAKLINKIYKRKANGSKSLNNSNIGKNIDNNEMSKIGQISIEHQKQKDEIILTNELLFEEEHENSIKETNINKIVEKKVDSIDIDNPKKNNDIKCDIKKKNEEEISKNKIILSENKIKKFNTKNEAQENKESEKEPNYSESKNINEQFLNFRREMDIYKVENEKKIELMKKEFEERLELLQEQNNIMKEENNLMKEENKLIKDNIHSLQNKNNRQDIEIKKMNNRIKLMTLELERISFRDLSKRVLNNMINFVNTKNGKLLEGLKKRKEKLKKINESFDFKGIEFMRKPFQEICDKYYHSNSRSHVPDIANNLKKRPYGFISDPENEILKKYYEIMIDSKQENILNFLANTLNLKNEIKALYL